MKSKVTRAATASGVVVRFQPPGPLPIDSEDWPHKGGAPSLSVFERGAHVELLVQQLNDFYAQRHLAGKGA